jgi:hypothetical protein
MTTQTSLILAAMMACAPRLAAAPAWTNWNDGQRLGSFYAVAGTTNETVAVGIDGLIATRNNQIGAWTTQIFTGDPDFRAIVYASHQYVVVREGGFIMTSPDGLTWTNRESPTTRNLMGLFWDGHQYLAGGDGGTILSSPDGIEWATRDSGSGINFYAFACSGSRYVAVGNDGIRISEDAIHWSPPDQAPDDVPFTSCAWTSKGFVACGLGSGKRSTIYTSPDGNRWTPGKLRLFESYRAAISVNGAVYIAGDNVIKKSIDGGATWSDTYPTSAGVGASLSNWFARVMPWVNASFPAAHSALFMGLAHNGQSLLATGFNHNVWALPAP